ncbi:BON domain-containing protein [Streptomyces sp. NBC_00377]|uniref:BON domain-containing protein n=1 Tax=unclassified Streptomyces TaxID=2593676 RepID=UPI002E2101AE|nr:MULTISPECIES: BON domain-containing protein [unclassified Streptomyces]
MSDHRADTPRAQTGAGGPSATRPASPPGATPATEPTNIEYRIASLEERLAARGLGELGMRVEAHGATVTVRGTVPTAQCREELLSAVHEELAGLAVHTDILIAEVTPPGSPEELS